MRIYTSSTNPINSFGRVAHSIAASLRKLGHDVVFGDDKRRVYDFAVDGPDSEVRAKFLVTFWEVTELSDLAVKNLKARTRRSEKVVVTCEFTREVLAKYNIKSAKIPLAAEHNALPLGGFSPLTFYSIYQDAGYPARKNEQALVDAFTQAFPRESDVKLLIKQGERCVKLVTFDNRIEIIRQYLHDTAPIHAAGHVFVSPCAAEGWGYPHHDAIAYGRPVVCPFVGGPVEFLNHSCAWFVPYAMKPAPAEHYNRRGKMGVVNAKDLAAVLREVYDNKQDILLKSYHAAQQAKNFTLDQMTVAIRKLISR